MTEASLYPPPSLAAKNEADKRPVDAVFRSNFALRYVTVQLSHIPNRVRVQLHRSMGTFVKGILNPCGPSNVVGVDASSVSLTARVRHFILGAGTFTMSEGTGNPVRNVQAPPPHQPSRIRPGYAVVCLGRDERRLNIVQRLAAGCSSRGGGAVPTPSDVMGLAPTFSVAGFATAANRAYGECSHSNTSSVLAWLERVVGWPAPARSSFVPQKHQNSKSFKRGGLKYA